MNVTELVSLVSRYIHRTNDIEVSQLCGLAEGTGAATLKTQTAITYTIGNTQYSKAITDNIPMTASAQQAAATFCYYLVSLNVAGTVMTTKGVDNAFALPSLPTGNRAIGAFKVVTAVATTFTSGTTDLSAAGITATYYDIDAGMALFFIQNAQTQLERGVRLAHNGRQISVSNWEYMKVRGDASLVKGNTTVSLPFSRFKCFADNGVTITDGSDSITQLSKRDIVPLDVTTQQRPSIISRLPTTETTFDPDVAPTMAFTVWPECDQAYTLNAIAYQYSPTLDGVIYTTNWLTENAPDILLFGALVESASYFPLAADQVTEWKSRWQDAVWTLYQAETQGRYNGSYLHTRFFNPLTGTTYNDQSINNG